MEEAEARYTHYLAEEMRVMRRNRMKNAFVLILLILILLIVTAFLIYVLIV
jgi:predicted nucleic acid-binding Zn ribbon protein